MQGEAFFEVQKDPEHGLEITAPHETKIEVLGTSFNVEAFEKDCFSCDPFTGSFTDVGEAV